MKISKLDAAESQLTEAIHLFFEERDSVSIHTLAHAAFEIVADYALAHDIPVMLHKTSPMITDEGREIWAKSVNRAKNFFKHADKDIKNNIIEIDFEPELNIFVILGAIEALKTLHTAKIYNSYEEILEYKIF